MSQDYHHHQGIFQFSNGFERSSSSSQQIQRDKVRGFQQQELARPPVYETAGMLSEMFNFPDDSSTAELLENATFRSSSSSSASRHQQQQQQPQTSTITGNSENNNNWYGNHTNNQQQQQHQHQISSINAAAADSAAAAAMHLFLMNPSHMHQTRSSSSPPTPHPQQTLHMFPNSGFGQFTWGGGTTQEGGGGVEGLSLSLCSSLEVAKADQELRSLYYNNNQVGEGGPSSSYQYKNHHNHHQALMNNLHLQQGGGTNNIIIGYNNNYNQHHQGLSSLNVVRNSKYMKAAQELLQEFCSVGGGRSNHQFIIKNNKLNSNPNNGDHPSNSSSSKDTPLPPLSASDRIEHQRRKVKLLSMLDEACSNISLSLSLFIKSQGPPSPYINLIT